MSRRDGGKTMRGDMYLAWSSSEEILNRTESGGLVISLLKFALESKRVDAVLAINARDGNRCDGIPVLITDPDEVISIAEALHCVTVNIPRYIKEYLRGAFDMKLAVVSKPCDIRGIIDKLSVEQPDNKAIEYRRKEEQEEINSVLKWQEKDFTALKIMTTEEKFNYWWGQFNQCIKCYGCRDACPICFCKDCI